MMGIEIVFSEKINEAVKKLESVAKDRMHEAVNETRNATLETLSGSRSGRQYRVPETKKIYTASSPGEAPARATSGLAQSVRGGVEQEGGAIVGFVGTEIKYGPMLEFGTSKMAARPWLRISFEKSAEAVKSIFTRLWF